MHEERVAIAHVLESALKLGPFDVLASRPVGEGLVKLDAVKLPLEVLNRYPTIEMLDTTAILPRPRCAAAGLGPLLREM